MASDTITEIPNTAAKRRAHPSIPDRGDDYVLAGLRLGYNNGTLTVSSGTLTLADGDSVYLAEVGARAFDISSDKTVYYDLQPGSPATGTVEVDTTPSEPRLELGSADVSAGTTTEVSRDPDQSFRALSTEEQNNTVYWVPSG
ncbi:MAG: hypothetical protein V5A30_05975, partial [Haloarculaceae archaeon]